MSPRPTARVVTTSGARRLRPRRSGSPSASALARCCGRALAFEASVVLVLTSACFGGDTPWNTGPDYEASSGNPFAETHEPQPWPAWDVAIAPDVADRSGCAGFLCPDDATYECDPWAQDCPVGEKCMPFAEDGRGWSALRCTPIASTPAATGERCTVEGAPYSGIDDCPLSSMCWGADPDTLVGTCIELCRGSAANPICTDPTSRCMIGSESLFNPCLPMCDPLLQDCAEGLACYGVNRGFACYPDQTWVPGELGDPCEYLDTCDAGSFCADAEAVPDCVGASGCCSAFCDLASDDPDAPCSAGQICVPWFEPGMAPPGYVEVGACMVPR